MGHTSLKERISYRFDRIMARGTSSMIIMLAVFTVLVIVIISLIINVCGFADGDGAAATAWDSFATVINSWVLYSGDGSAGYILVMAVAALCGLLITSLLIGILSTAIEDKVQSLRCGDSRVLENGHALILGFNEGVYEIIRELCLANGNAGACCIVILGDEEKPVMEERIRQNVDLPRGVRVVCRSGDTTSAPALLNCALINCGSIIVNEPDDISAIKTIMSVMSLFRSESVRPDVRVVSAVRHSRSLLPAEIAGEGRCSVLAADGIVARMMARTSREPGISEVFTEIFSFAGDEFHIADFPTLCGRRFGELNLCLSDATPLGLVRGDEMILNPGASSIVEPGDSILVLAEGRNSAAVADACPEIDRSAFSGGCGAGAEQPEKLLIIGCNDSLPPMLRELALSLPAGSRLILAGAAEAQSGALSQAAECLRGFAPEISGADVFDRGELESLVLAGVSHVTILNDRELKPEQADGNTLLLLLQLRDIKRRYSLSFGITSEMNFAANQRLAANDDVADFIISSRIIGLMVSQVAVNPRLLPAFMEILSDEGSEFYLEDAERFVLLDREMTVSTVSASVARTNRVFVGYRRRSSDGCKITVNPRNSSSVAFSAGDQLIVLAGRRIG